MNWHTKKVLITGAGGFIGSHLCQRLLWDGASVRALVHYRADGSHGWLGQEGIAGGQLEVMAGDVRDRESVAQAIRGQDMVFHLAALISIPYSYENPSAYFLTNTMGTMNILLEAERQGIEKIIHLSSSEVYGTAMYTPMDERHPLVAQSPYAASKVSADKAVESFYHSFGLPVVTARPFNCYGPRQSERAVIPSIIIQALRGGPIKVASCDSSRDFTFVEDTVRGLLRIAERGKMGGVYNLASGTTVTLTELLDRTQKVIGCDLPINLDQSRNRPNLSEVKLLHGDPRLAKRALEWMPEIGLEEGLARTVHWLRSNLHRYSGHYTI